MGEAVRMPDRRSGADEHFACVERLLAEINRLVLDKSSGFVQVNISEGRMVSLKVDRTIALKPAKPS